MVTSTTKRSSGTEERTEVTEHRHFRWAHAFRERIRAQPHADLVYRIGIGVLGGLIVVIGLILVPFPGPGWAIVVVGLILLATEFHWARELLVHVRAKLVDWTHWLGRQSWVVRVTLVASSFALAATVSYCVLIWLGVPHWVPADWVTWAPGLRRRD
jgi:uncharacterized protein (TIGR02611 family)